ncbi:terminase small subunit [Microvirga sp. TS319]|uniref:terminase small subunit n=1 Tax=Microvirga sp. TS319 TaxID=3241165 RepID=UPI003519F6FB
MTPKQARFVDEYLVDLNGAQAVIRAGYSPKNPDVQAAQLFARPEIVAAIQDAMSKRADRLEITSERVLEEIAAMAFYDPADLMVDVEPEEGEENSPLVVNGRTVLGLRGPHDIQRLPENVRRAIVGWGYDRNQNFTVKLADKSKALDQLARHLSLYNDKLAIDGLDSLAERLARASKRGEREPAPVSPASIPDSTPHPLHERLRRVTAHESRVPAPKGDWEPPKAQRPNPEQPKPPQYQPILPVSWLTQSGQVDVEYDPSAGFPDYTRKHK